MRVALTGASGLIGRVIADQLIAGGHAVRVSTRRPEALAGVTTDVEVVAGDLRSASVRERLVSGVDAVIHCAATLRSTNERLLDEVNVHVTRELAEAARAQDVPRFVFMSSTGVYGQRGRVADEMSPHRPRNAYERAKSAAEAAASAHLGRGALVVVRPSNVIAERHPNQPLLRFLRRIRDASIVYSRSAQANYVHVDAVAEVACRALASDAPPAVIVNDGLPLVEFARLARAVAGARPRPDRVIPPLVGFLVAAALEPHAQRHAAVSRALALVDDTRFDSRHREWAGQTSPGRSVEAWLARLTEFYRSEGSL